MLPAVADGAKRVGRAASDVKVIMRPMLATAPDAETLAPRIRDIRARVAFYASTPAYPLIFGA
jgi:hypothetical protein